MCTNVNVSAYVYAYVYVCVCSCMCTSVYVICVYGYGHRYLHAHVYVHVYVSVDVHVYVYVMQICIYACTYAAALSDSVANGPLGGIVGHGKMVNELSLPGEHHALRFAGWTTACTANSPWIFLLLLLPQLVLCSTYPSRVVVLRSLEVVTTLKLLTLPRNVQWCPFCPFHWFNVRKSLNVCGHTAGRPSR